jgi:Holliday junction resolvase
VSSRSDYYFQRRVMRRLEREGYYVVRSTGLRRPFDIIAVRRDGALAVRCSGSGHVGVEEASRLSELALRYGMRAAIAYRDHGSISFRSL